MQIVHVTECLAGGVLTFLLNLTKALDEEQHVIIYSRRDNTPDDVESLFGSNVKMVPWKYAGREIRAKQDLLALLELMRLLRQYPQADVVQLHSSKAGFLGRLACRLLSRTKKVFYLPHGLSFAREDVSAKKKRFYTCLEKLGNSFCGDVIACSNSERDLLVKNGICNVHVIHTGIEVESQEPQYRKFSYPLVVGTVGRITFAKNPKLFNDIAMHFRCDKRIKFVWIGDGELRGELENADNLEVTGWLDAQEVRMKLQKVDVYLSTSLWEGLPLSVLEAMNLGKPLILTDCIGNVDLVQQDINGLVFHSLEEGTRCIKCVLNDPSRVSEMGRCSYGLLLQDYSVQQMREKYLRLFKDC